MHAEELMYLWNMSGINGDAFSSGTIEKKVKNYMVRLSKSFMFHIVLFIPIICLN